MEVHVKLQDVKRCFVASDGFWKQPWTKSKTCPLCGKTFIKPWFLRRHMSVHTGKQYECEACPQRFASSQTLRSHIQLKHQGQAQY